jgi:hypothetical protein
VQSASYEIPENLLSGPLVDPLLRAEDALASLDERARSSALREGWQARLLYGEACASRLAEGELVHLEDLVLLDNGAQRRGPCPLIEPGECPVSELPFRLPHALGQFGDNRDTRELNDLVWRFSRNCRRAVKSQGWSAIARRHTSASSARSKGSRSGPDSRFSGIS